METGEIKYAPSGDHEIAFRVIGAGPVSVLMVAPVFSTIECLLTDPLRRIVDRITGFGRLIGVDRRGVGLSGGEPAPTLEEQMTDIEAVLVATHMAHGKGLALYAEIEGALLSCMFAATHPGLVSHLVIYNGFARSTRAEGYDWAWSEEERERLLVEPNVRSWGTGEAMAAWAPVLTSEIGTDWWGRMQRMFGTPREGREYMRLWGRMDVRGVLPQVQAPTLVLHRPSAPMMDTAHAEYLAECIPNATLRQIPGRDGPSCGDGIEAWGDAIEEFITGGASGPVIDPTRALSTVAFTDIVGSTKRAAELGDSAWRELLHRHDELSRRLVTDHGGNPVKSTGDGYLATFDGPARAVRCATALIEQIRELGIELRAGVHTGEVELLDGDVAGIAVHIGARIGALAGPGEVLASTTVRDLVVGSGIEFQDHGEHELKGVPGEWRLCRVEAVPGGPWPGTRQLSWTAWPAMPCWTRGDLRCWRGRRG